MVGSSRNNSSGSTSQAHRYVQPALLASRELADPGPALLGEANDGQYLGERERLGVIATKQVYGLFDGQVGLHPRGLQHNANALLETAIVPGGIVPKHVSGPRAPITMSLENLHHRRFAGTVGSQKGEYLALEHLEVDPSYGFHLPIRLAEPGHVYSDNSHRMYCRTNMGGFPTRDRMASQCAVAES